MKSSRPHLRVGQLESLEARLLLAASSVLSVGPALSAAPQDVVAPRALEWLDRGVVAVRTEASQVYVSWRLLGLDPTDIAFNLYRQTNGGTVVKLNATPLTQTTDFVDVFAPSGSRFDYYVRPVTNGVEGEPSKVYALGALDPVRPYLSLPLDIPAGGVTDDGEAYTYVANDASVGDLDGDGDYEIVLKWQPTNEKHAGASGQTGNTILDAYTLEGEKLWRIDLGINIRSGPQYNPFLVFDFDGDGRAELVTRTAPGTTDGLGNDVIVSGDDPNADYRNADGHINEGPEYLTVFDGYTGQNLATVNLEPARGPLFSWGDQYGNRANQFLMAAAYLDGVRPSIVVSRDYNQPQSGLPGRDELAAFNWRDGALTLEWHFKAGINWHDNQNSEYVGQGNHQISVADVDVDGFDEIVRGASIIDHDGTGYLSTGAGHGDAMHVGDLDPSNPGIEVFSVHQVPAEYSNVSGLNVGGHLYDAATGTVLANIPATNDVGRGAAMDIDPNYPGAEFWATTNDPNGGSRFIYNVDGTALYPMPSNMFNNFGVWWDADPIRELLDREYISKWRYDWASPGRQNIVQAWQLGAASNNGTKATPALSGDILGDWREEVIWRSSDSSELQIWTTTIPATNRMYTLMHDSQYRSAIAWQNNIYNQPPHPSFFIGADMADPPTPLISYTPFTGDLPVAPIFYQAEEAQLSGAFTLVQDDHFGYRGTGYVNVDTTGSSIEFQNVDGGDGGSVSIAFRFALGNVARSGLLTVNGVAVPLTFPSTGAWSSWDTLAFSVPLEAGAVNTIRLESNGEDLANIDELQVVPSVVELPDITPENLDLLCSAVSGSGSLESWMDVNDDGVTDASDVAYWVTTLVGTVPGDVNLDGEVGLLDLDLMGQHWGQSGTWSDGDVNCDGQVSLLDLDILGQFWGQPAALASVAASPQGNTDVLSIPVGSLAVAAPRVAQGLVRSARSLDLNSEDDHNIRTQWGGRA